VLVLIADLPEGTVGVEAHAAVTAEDDETCSSRPSRRPPSSRATARCACCTSGHEFPDYSAGAAWQDTKLGLADLREWERIAIVGDAPWLHDAIHGLGRLPPGQIEVFAIDDLHGAREWITSPGPDPERMD